MDKAKIVYKLEGGSGIDANTLINVLTHQVAIVEETNKILGGGSKDVRVKVNALNPGSFEIHLEVITDFFGELFSRGLTEYAASIVTVVDGVYRLFRRLRGKKTTEEEVRSSTVINDNSVTNITNITNVYNSYVVRSAVRSSLKTASEDPVVEGLTIYREDESTTGVPFWISKDELSDLADVDLDNAPLECTQTISDVSLIIVSLNFEKDKTWQFVYDGNRIACKMKDDALQKEIDGGMSFQKGDALIATLEVKKVFDNSINAYVNKSYRILDVSRHIRRAERLPLDLSEDGSYMHT